MIKEIRDGIDNGSAVIGSDRALKTLRASGLSKIFVAKNCPESVINEIKSTLGSAEFVQIEQNNDEFGVLCKRQHSISVLGLKND